MRSWPRCKPGESRNQGCTHSSAVDSPWDLVYSAFFLSYQYFLRYQQENNNLLLTEDASRFLYILLSEDLQV